MSKLGVIINNIGTPQSPKTADVRVYLREFLMDPGVISLPFVFRWLLVNGIIAPLRAHRSGEKYRKIWTSAGSPLMVGTLSFAKKLQEQLGATADVRVGMRYGAPSLHDALIEFQNQGITRILLAPMYPQWSEATTDSAVQETRALMDRIGYIADLQVLEPFFDQEFFVRAYVDLLREQLRDENFEHLLFSFHGLPEAAIKKVSGCELSKECCERATACASNCYRAQSFATAKILANGLGLSRDRWSVSFQSRLGPARWIGPATDEVVSALADKGIRNLAISCPSFVTDCLETLEEIGLEQKNAFENRGGSLHLLPCLNDNDSWVRGFAAKIQGGLSDSHRIHEARN